MLKWPVNYEDFNGEPKHRELYFHVGKTEIIKMVSNGELDPDELKVAAKNEDKKEMFNFIVFLIEKSYGEKSTDGEVFLKNDSIMERFKCSAAYDALIGDLMSDTGRLVEFFKGIFPKGAIEEAIKQLPDLGLPASPLLGTGKTSPPKFTNPEKFEKSNDDRIRQLEKEIERLRLEGSKDAGASTSLGGAI